MGLIDVLHMEVFNYQCEGELIVTMLPQSICEFYGCIAISVEVLDESIVGKEAVFWGDIHALLDSSGNFSITCNGTQVVLGDDLVWDFG